MPVELDVCVAVIDGVSDGVEDGDDPGESDDVGDDVGVDVSVVEGVDEHEPATARPVVVQPHTHGIGATDASGQ